LQFLFCFPFFTFLCNFNSTLWCYIHVQIISGFQISSQCLHLIHYYFQVTEICMTLILVTLSNSKFSSVFQLKLVSNLNAFNQFSINFTSDFKFSQELNWLILFYTMPSSPYLRACGSSIVPVRDQFKWPNEGFFLFWCTFQF